MKINVATIRVIDGEIHLDGVAMMENGCSGFIGIGEAERSHQAVGRLVMLGQTTFNYNPVDLIIL